MLHDSLSFEQLLNQTEGTGPPPATKEDIDTLPSTTITQDFVGERDVD